MRGEEKILGTEETERTEERKNECGRMKGRTRLGWETKK